MHTAGRSNRIMGRRGAGLRWGAWIASVGLALSLAACSFVGPRTQAIRIQTNPEGAVAYANGRQIGTTPVTYTADRDKDIKFEFEKDGYKRKVHISKKKLSALGIVDIVGAVIWYVPALGIIAPGAWEHDNRVNLTLHQGTDAPSGPAYNVTSAPPSRPQQSAAPSRPPANRPADAAMGGPREAWAVVVGIGKYKHSGGEITNLAFADKDARDFARALQASGWSPSNIKLLTNEEATERNIRIALESWLTKATADDLIVLYWAGHGFPDPEDPRMVYFACHDTQPSIPATGYRMDRVRETLEERGARNVVMLADTCNAGKLVTRGDSRAVGVVSANVQKMQRVPQGWVFMVGADTDRQALEHSSWSNGAFTKVLLDGLQGQADGRYAAKDGRITMGELRDYLRDEMPAETQRVFGVAKHPVITTNTGDADIWNLPLSRR